MRVLQNFNIDPAEMLRNARLDAKLFDDPDNWMTYGARDRLLSLCVARTGCQHFGLLVGRQMNLNALGLVGVLVRNSSDVGTALRSLVRYFRLHTQGATTSLTVYGNLAMLTYDVVEPDVAGNDQTVDGAVAMMLNVMRTLCGPRFVPIEARFAHRKPVDVRPFRRFFGVPVRFEAEHNALLFPSDWLAVRRLENDVELQRLLQKQIDSLEVEFRHEFPEQVRRVLRSALLTGQASAGQVAALFSMHARTLSRRLEQFGTNFQELVDGARFEIARQMLEGTTRDLGEIAEVLGYSRASAFTRAFHRWSGTTPLLWRAKRIARGFNRLGSTHRQTA